MNRPTRFWKMLLILLPGDISSPRIHFRDTSLSNLRRSGIGMVFKTLSSSLKL